MTESSAAQISRTRILILGCAFASGFSIMTVELLGGKMLAPWFGGSVFVWGSIITVFMLALSVGYLLGGRLSLASPSLARYSLLFFAAAIAVVPVALFDDPLGEWVFDHVEDPRYGSLLASIGLFFLPTTLMGMIGPYSVRLLVSSTDSSGHTAGHLYFVSTIGSALGTLATSFYLVLWFDIDHILFAVAVAMILCGATLLIRHRTKT